MVVGPADLSARHCLVHAQATAGPGEGPVCLGPVRQYGFPSLGATLLGSTGGTILAIFGVFPLGCCLARSRVGGLALAAMVTAIASAIATRVSVHSSPGPSAPGEADPDES